MKSPIQIADAHAAIANWRALSENVTALKRQLEEMSESDIRIKIDTRSRATNINLDRTRAKFVMEAILSRLRLLVADAEKTLANQHDVKVPSND